jgi:hypothetical protein
MIPPGKYRIVGQEGLTDERVRLHLQGERPDGWTYNFLIELPERLGLGLTKSAVEGKGLGHAEIVSYGAIHISTISPTVR